MFGRTLIGVVVCGTLTLVSLLTESAFFVEAGLLTVFASGVALGVYLGQYPRVDTRP